MLMLECVQYAKELAKENGEPAKFFIGEDNSAYCEQSKVEVTNSNLDRIFSRLVMVHSLHHGTFQIGVPDYACPHFRRYTPYDGRSDALFCLSRRHAFSRELLDSWLCYLCGSGGTFRDVFSSWSSKNFSTRSSLLRLGMHSNFSRQRGNDAFSAYLKTLRFVEEDYLSNLFSCKKCARNPESENRDLDAVVMNGTALGILGTVPQFERHTKVLSAVPGISDRQYKMRNPKLRAFLDAVFRSARNAGTRNRFHLSVKPSLWRKRHE